MQIAPYLNRIGSSRPSTLTPATLADLHLAHLRTVPFENLDIPLGRPIRLAPEVLYDKIVRRRRGGYCFELNGLFCLLLRELGVPATLLSARVFRQSDFGPDFEHALILLEGPKLAIADVGFGDSFLTPLPLEREREHLQGSSRYRLSSDGATWILEQQSPKSAWAPQFAFTLTPRRLLDFAPMSEHLSTSPDSPFTRKAVCSVPTADGRITLSGNRLIVTASGDRHETIVATPQDYRRYLATYFRMALEPEADIDRLMALASPSN